MAKAKEKLAAYKSEMEELNRLYENEAPSERKGLYSNSKCKNIIARTVAHVGEVIHEQSSFGLHSLIQWNSLKLCSSRFALF